MAIQSEAPRQGPVGDQSSVVDQQSARPTKTISRRNLLIGAGVGGAGLLTAAGLAAVNRFGNNSDLGNQTPQGGGESSANPKAPSVLGVETVLEATPTPEVKKEPTTLREWADKAGIEIGVSIAYRTTPEMLPLYSKEFNGASVVDFNWDKIEPRRGNVTYDNRGLFAYPEPNVDFGVSNKMKVNGQALVFTSEYPTWLKESNFSRAEATDVLRKHVNEVVSHFKGRVSRWVVVNEFNPLSWGRDDILQRIIGQDVPEIAFEAAREADPSATLIYNNNGNHEPNLPSTATTMKIVERLKAKGLIDGVGLQMHLDGSKPPSRDGMIKTMQGYGLPIYITEMDVNMKDVPGTQEERFAKQAEIYRNVFQAGLDSGVCRSFSFFTVGDQYSWIERSKTYQHASTNGDPTIFDDNLKPKPAYGAVFDVLKAEALKKA